MTYEIEFAAYIQQYYKYANQSTKRILENIQRYIDDNEIAVLDDLREYIFSTHGDKEQAAKIIEDFIQKANPENTNVIADGEIEDNPTLRQLKIAKYLQEPHTKTEIGNYFHISDGIVQRDLAKLREGLDVLGTRVCINETETRTSDNKVLKQYLTTAHPLFLPLNLSEIYLMTIGLMKETQTSPMREKYAELVGRIVSQLSDYAIEKLESVDDEKLLPQKTNNDYRAELLQSKTDRMLYALKSGDVCACVSFLHEGALTDCTNATIKSGHHKFYRIISETSEYEINGEDVIDVVLNATI